MSFGQSISYCFSNYFNFSGRGSRSEYWWFFLFSIMLQIAGSIWDATSGDFSGSGLMYWIAYAVVFFPSLAAGARRLHDLGKSWSKFFDIISYPCSFITACRSLSLKN